MKSRKRQPEVQKKTSQVQEKTNASTSFYSVHLELKLKIKNEKSKKRQLEVQKKTSQGPGKDITRYKKSRPLVQKKTSQVQKKTEK